MPGGGSRCDDASSNVVRGIWMLYLAFIACSLAIAATPAGSTDGRGRWRAEVTAEEASAESFDSGTALGSDGCDCQFRGTRRVGEAAVRRREGRVAEAGATIASFAAVAAPPHEVRG